MSDYRNRKHLSAQAAGWCFAAVFLLTAGAVIWAAGVALWKWL